MVVLGQMVPSARDSREDHNNSCAGLGQLSLVGVQMDDARRRTERAPVQILKRNGRNECKQMHAREVFHWFVSGRKKVYGWKDGLPNAMLPQTCYMRSLVGKSIGSRAAAMVVRSGVVLSVGSTGDSLSHRNRPGNMMVKTVALYVGAA
ncbi:MAG: hypothetical protein Q9210_003331 [Variospora velana]